MKRKNYLTVCFMACFLMGMSVWNLAGEKREYSETERRVLAKFPKITIESVLSGKFSKEFEEYAVDAFPMRDAWRSVKAYVKTGLFLQKDNNGIYTAEGHLSKLEYPMNEKMLEHAIEVLTNVKENYLNNNDVYFVIVPDKNRYLAERNGHLCMNYEMFSEYMTQRMEFATYIELADLLSLDDYYKTDTHWRQENLLDVAERIASTMGVDITRDYEPIELEIPFNGVYVGQAALACQPDTIWYLANDALNRVNVTGAQAIYDMDKAKGKDAYEIFLSGNQPIVTMKNVENSEGKRLIMFRDSFGSSIAPLLISGYSEIVLVDLRYISSEMLDKYVDFDNADVLFLYSTIMLNNSLGIK